MREKIRYDLDDSGRFVRGVISDAGSDLPKIDNGARLRRGAQRRPPACHRRQRGLEDLP